MSYITITQPNLLRAIRPAASAVSGKGQLPILAHLLLSIDTDRNVIRAVGSDLEVWIDQTAPFDSAGVGAEEVFPVTAPAKTLVSLIEQIPSRSMITLTPDDGGLVIQAAKIRTRLLRLDAEGYPLAPSGEIASSVTMPAGQWTKMLEFVESAQSVDDKARPNMCGTFLECADGAVTVVATDTQRIATITEKPAEGGMVPATAILPTRSAKLVSGLAAASDAADSDGVVQCDFTKDGQMRFSWPTLTVTSRLVDMKYPNYKRATPTGHEFTVTVDRNALAASVKRAMLTVTGGGALPQITLTIGAHEMTVASKSGSIGATDDSVEIAITGVPAEEYQFSIDGGNLSDMLRAFDTEAITFYMTAAHRPFVVREPGDGNGGKLWVMSPLVGM